MRDAECPEAFTWNLAPGKVESPPVTCGPFWVLGSDRMELVCSYFK